MTDFKSFSIQDGNIKINVNLARFDERYKKAQFWLDNEVMNSMVPYIPIRTGTLRNETQLMSRSVAGTGIVYAAAPPYGRFHYYGKVMVDEETGSPWAKKGNKKVVTDRPLTWSNPKTVPFWFDVVKRSEKNRWISGVKRIVGGGNNG